jgi:hypothetical protein
MMAAPILTPSLAALRMGFNLLAPTRDKASDGWIGDRAHQESTSGHNPDDTPGSKSEFTDADSIPEVRAVDVDGDLRRPGVTMLKVIQAILADPNALKRLRYIIYNRVIWSRTTGWAPRAYTGSNPHDQHAHFSGDPADDANGSRWTAVINAGGDMSLTEAQWKVIDATAWRVDALIFGLETVRGGPYKGEANQLTRSLNRIEKNTQAAAARADGLMGLSDVVSAWSTQNPEAVEPNVLRQALEQIHQEASSPAVPVTVNVTPEQLAQALTVALASLRVEVTTNPGAPGAGL